MLTLILLLSIPIVLSASVSTDKNDYYPGDTVFISGSEFSSNIDVIIQINDPADTVKFVNQIRTDNDGNFSTTYNISSDAVSGTYAIYASGGGTQVQENFTLSPKPITTTTVPSDGNGGGGGRTTTTTITNGITTTTMSGRVTTTTRLETTTSMPKLTTTILPKKRPIINSRTITIIGVAIIVPVILFVIFVLRVRKKSRADVTFNLL